MTMKTKKKRKLEHKSGDFLPFILSQELSCILRPPTPPHWPRQPTKKKTIKKSRPKSCIVKSTRAGNSGCTTPTVRYARSFHAATKFPVGQCADPSAKPFTPSTPLQ